MPQGSTPPKRCIGYGTPRPPKNNSVLVRREMSPLVNRMFLDFPRAQDVLLRSSEPVLFTPCHTYAKTLAYGKCTRLWDRALTGDIALPSSAKHVPLTVPLYTQVCNWVAVSLILLAASCHRNRNRAGLMGRLTRLQTTPYIRVNSSSNRLGIVKRCVATRASAVIITCPLHDMSRIKPAVYSSSWSSPMLSLESLTNIEEFKPAICLQFSSKLMFV